MNFDKKSLLAFLLIGLVFLLVQTPFYQKLFPPPHRPMPVRPAATDSLAAAPADLHAENPGSLPTQAPVLMADSLRGPQIKPRVIKVNTNLYQAVFTSRGALLTQWTLHKYTTDFGSPVQMLADPLLGNLAFSFVNRDGDSTTTADWNFTCESDTLIDASTAKQTLRFVAQLNPEQKIIKEIEIEPNRYDFKLTLILQNMNEIIADKAYTLAAPAGLQYTEQSLKEDMSYAKSIVAAAGEYIKSDKANGQTIKESGAIDWIAVRTKYFLLAIIPQKDKGIYTQSRAVLIASTLKPREQWKKIAISLTMPYTRNDYRESFTIFAGPMDDELLKSYGAGLENSMDMGMKIIQPISAAVLWTFKRIHHYVANYGLVLVIFSLLIKIVLTPLTNKSYTSMKKMQQLQPLMQELKEKYGKDPQRLNTETMKLYKEQGINPMSGCFPIVLQIPIFIALFNVFRSTIELRQQGFFGWITDLSKPDTIGTLAGIPINILPILMGGTMIVQQMMTVTDPKQKAMMYMMPALMIFMFYSFPSGLNLYYTIFNILSIIQQKYLMPSS